MPQPAPVSRLRLPVIAIAVWAAILAAIIAVSLVFGGQGPANGTNTPLGAAGAKLTANFNAPLAADPSASSGAGTSTAPGNPIDNDGGWKGTNGFGPGRGGPGGFGRGGFGFGPGGPGRGHGPVSISAINGSQVSLKTDDGWTRTIDATGTTITEQGGAAITIGDLTVGDQIGFGETRNTDGTFKITTIIRIPPQASGTVKSVDANSATLTLPDGTTKAIALTGSTTYTLNGKAAAAADLGLGTRVHATGTVAGSGAFTATKIDIAPAQVAGTVTAKTANTITIKDRSGASFTITVDGSTTYGRRGANAATLADVAVGDVLEAEGTLNGDGSLKATSIRFGQPGPGGFGGPGPGGFGGPGMGGGFGHGVGPGRGPGFGHGGGNQPDGNATPAPSTSGG